MPNNLDFYLKCRYCNLCFENNKITTLQDIKFFKTTTATPNFKLHLKDHGIYIKDKNDLASMQANFSSRLYIYLTLMLCLDDLPFNLVIKQGFNLFINFLKASFNFEFNIPSNSFLANYILPKVYVGFLNYAKRLIDDQFEYGCFSLDVYSDPDFKKDFLGFNLVFFDSNLNLQKILLDIQPFNTKQDGNSILERINTILSQFNLSSNSLLFISDEGTNVINALEKGEFDFIICLDHRLHNLVMEDSLKNCKELVDLIKKVSLIVNKFRNNKTNALERERYELLFNEFDAEFESNLLLISSSLQSLDELSNEELANKMNQQYENDIEYERAFGGASFKKAIKIRFNSLGGMLKSFIKNKGLINRALLRVDQASLILNETEFKIVAQLECQLEKFQTVYDCLSKESEITLNEAIPCYLDLKYFFDQKNDYKFEKEINLFRDLIRTNLDQRFVINNLIFVGALLDPMIKDRNFLNQFDFNKRQILYENLDDNEDNGLNLSKSNENANKDERTKRLERLDEFYNDDESSSNEDQSFKRTSIAQLKFKEIDEYLNLKNVNYLNLREFWIENQFKCPNLFVLFKKIGCAQVANILTERTFSHVNSKTSFKNTNLKEENLKMIVFIKENFTKKLEEDFEKNINLFLDINLDECEED